MACWGIAADAWAQATCFGQPATIVGTEGDDTLHGTPGADVIVGLGGNDIIRGLGGNDLLCGGVGDDLLEGGDGEDQLDGGDGDDQLFGGSGNDLLLGKAGHNHLDGEDGDDQIEGDNGNDTLLGGTGHDQLLGRGGDDVLDGGPGDDFLDGKGGADILYGGPGDDILIGGDDADQLFGEAGYDELEGGKGDDRLEGGDGDDELRGDEGHDTLIGGAGHDHLDGGPGNDLLQGNAGDDSLEGKGGNDILHGGAGNDTLSGGEDDDQLAGGVGTDTLTGNTGTDTCLGGETVTFCDADGSGDTTLPTLTLTAPGGAITDDLTPDIVLQYADTDTGVDLTTLRVLVDTLDITATCLVTPTLGTCASPALGAGSHTASAELHDLAGNLATASTNFTLTLNPGPHTATFSASADTVLRQDSANTNQGEEPVLRLQDSGIHRALVQFDPAHLAAVVDEGTLLSATLELFIAQDTDNWGSSGHTVDVHRLTEDWDELSATWQCASDTDVSNALPDCVTPWQGGSFLASATDSVLHTNALAGWVAFDVSSDVAALLTGTPHYGWLVKKTDEAHSGQVDYTARDGDSTQQPRLVVVFTTGQGDTTPPTLSITAPSAPYVLNDATPALAVTYADAGSGVALATLQIGLDGSALTPTCTVGASAATCTAPPLADGAHTLSAEIRDQAGNLATASVNFTLDTQPPADADTGSIDVSAPQGGSVTVTGGPGSVEPSVQVRLSNTRTGSVVLVTADATGSFVAQLAAQDGDSLTLQLLDAAGNTSGAQTLTVGGGLPPDPATVAPPLATTEVTPLAAATAFLYTGPAPIQRGVAAGTIAPRRVAVVRGKVLDRAGAPLPGVTITVKDHPELGDTLSRADGMFDLAVNGGGLLTLNYQKHGYLPVQRQVQTPWQDYVFAADVVLLPLDPQVTQIALNGSSLMQVAQGSPSTDADGTRQATILFPPGTTASMRLADGTTQPLNTLHVRATEYTVGATGPKAMPGPLPSTSGYTYAVELSVDEAIAAGATRVDFTQPVPVYVDNFLNFPVGGIVPVGWYDRDTAAWIPSEDGTIVQPLGADGTGRALLDVDGSGQAADASTLSTLGISDTERGHLATLYPVGKSLWRVPVTHFTPWDYNWPYGPPDDADPPPPDKPTTDDDDQPDSEDNDECPGCSIEAQSQTLGEEIPLTGTPFRLYYRSDRVPGRKGAYEARIPLSGGAVPASLLRIELEIEVAGQQFQAVFPPVPNQAYTFVWDGLDAYGRQVTGYQTALVKIGYAYALVYRQPAAFAGSFSRAFGRASGSGVTFAGQRGRQDMVFWKAWQLPLRARAIMPVVTQLGGWSFGVHHTYEAVHRVYHGGDGTKRSARDILGVMKAEADVPRFWWRGDGGPATQAQLAVPGGVAFAPDGGIYFADSEYNRVLRVGPDGSITTVAGSGEYGFSGDGDLATQAQLRAPTGVALAPDGSLYIADFWNHRIRRVDPEGVITTVAGNGTDFSGDGVPATQTGLTRPEAVALAADGSLYIADGERRIRRVGPEGIITTVAGDGQFGSLGDGDLAIHATLLSPKGVALAPDGSLYIADAVVGRVRQVHPDGLITTVAGGGLAGSPGDGGPATQAHLRWPTGVALAADGSLYIADAWDNRIRRVGPDGVITTMAGTGQYGFSGDGGFATQAHLAWPHAIALATDGSLYIADLDNRRIRRVGPDGLLT